MFPLIIYHLCHLRRLAIDKIYQVIYGKINIHYIMKVCMLSAIEVSSSWQVHFGHFISVWLRFVIHFVF